jgi:hypothetical protein
MQAEAIVRAFWRLMGTDDFDSVGGVLAEAVVAE